jgi:hypothetical protein
MIAATWVDLYHAAFVSKSSLEQENERIRMSAVRKDLETCYGALQTREAELQQRISMLGRQAVMYKQGKNPASARKKMLERVRASAQASKIKNRMIMIDMHRSTIEGTVLDLSVLETLKASGDALRHMGVSKEGINAVDNLMSGLEESMQSAAKITQVLSLGSVSGVVNTMAAFGTAIDEDELMRELDDMVLDEQGEPGPSGKEAVRDPPPMARSNQSQIPWLKRVVEGDTDHAAGVESADNVVLETEGPRVVNMIPN